MHADPRAWQALMPLLDEALALPAHERPAWLEGLHVERTVKSMLRRVLAQRAELDRAGFLAGLPAIVPATEGPPAAPASMLQPGGRVGMYRLVREIGQGGMSVVWLAERDDGQLRREVALKIPHAGPGQHLLAERLRRERDFLAGLQHPHIARLYDVGVTAQGLPFLVLEYVQGLPIVEHCRVHGLSVQRRLALFVQALGAVQHAHERLVLHRDLKPTNMLVDASGEVRLLDFGIAKLMAEAPVQATELTREAGRPMTPDYAAPEQVAGAPLSTATDVYALGVVLYELLTGERPYRLPRATRGALEEAILHTEPARPSSLWRQAADARAYASTPGRMAHALRGDLDLIVLTALHKDPARRYATAQALAQDIQRHLARLPIEARPSSRWYRARRFVARHALATGLSAALVATLAGGMGASLLQARRAELEAAKANAVKDFLVGLFQTNSIDRADALARRRQSVQDLLEQSARALRDGLDGQPLVSADLQEVVGRLLHDLELSEAAIDVRRRRAALLASLRAPVGERAQAAQDLAASLAQRGDHDGARAALGQALKDCPAPDAASAPIPCLSAQLSLGLIEARAHRLEEAAARIEPAAAALLQRVPGSAEAADALMVRGELQGTRNRPEEAYALYRQAMALRSTLWGPQSARLARERYALALNLWAERRHAEAEAELQQALSALQAALGIDHVGTATVELQLGRLRNWVQGTGHDELRHASTVLLAAADRIGADKAYDARMAQAEALLYSGRLREAGPAMEALAAGPLPEGELGQHARSVLAAYWQATGRYADARHALLELLAERSGTLPPHHPYVADPELRLAALDLVQGDLDGAEARYRRVLASQDTREQAQGSYKHRASAGLARVLIERGQPAGALPEFEAQAARAAATPRQEQFWRARVGLALDLARALAGAGQLQRARAQYEALIAEYEHAYAHAPELAAARAHYATSLAALGEAAAARRQIALARAALVAEPAAGPHFARAVDQAENRLSQRACDTVPRDGVAVSAAGFRPCP